jgi:hypothetical protein
MSLPTLIVICSAALSNYDITNAIIETGSQEKPLAITATTQEGQVSNVKDFKSEAAASAYANKQLALGNSLEVGLMQIPGIWFPALMQQGVVLDDLLLSCNNITRGSDLLVQAKDRCVHKGYKDAALDQCALSVYKTGSETKGQAYAAKILSYAQAHPFQNGKYKQQQVVVDYVELPKPFMDAKSTDAASEDSDNMGSTDDSNSKQ